jgi:hypothetical protein
VRSPINAQDVDAPYAAAACDLRLPISRQMLSVNVVR